MRQLKRRLDRLNIQMGLGPETDEEREAREAADAIGRARALDQGLPPPPPCQIRRYRPGEPRLSSADAIKLARERCMEQAGLL
jgi:hypothetical protein